MLSIYKWISSWTYLFPDFYSLFSIQGITDERKIYKYTFVLFSRGYTLSLLRKKYDNNAGSCPLMVLSV